MKYIITILFSFLITQTNAQLFTNVFNSKAALILPALDGFGNSYLAGYFGDSTNIGGGMLYGGGFNDPILTKLDANGNLLWTKHGGGIGNDKFTKIQTDAFGNVYAIIQFEGTLQWNGQAYTSYGGTDFLLVKYNTNGNLLWQKQIGSTTDENGLYAYLNADQNNNLHLTAVVNSTALKINNVTTTLSALNTNFTDITFNPNTGATISITTFAKCSSNFAQGAGVLYVDKAGNMYGSIYGNNNSLQIAGTPLPNGQYQFRVNKNGTLAWSKLVQYASDRGESIAADTNGNIIWTGDWDTQINLFDTTKTQTGIIGNDVFVVCYDSIGTRKWVKFWGGVLGDEAPVVKRNDAGYFTIIGTSGSMTVDGFALSTLPNNQDIFWININGNGVVQNVNNTHCPTTEVIFNGQPAAIDNIGNMIISCGASLFTGQSTNFGSFNFNTVGKDFFNLYIVANACQATGKVYKDFNNNGSLDVSDAGLPNVIVASNPNNNFAISGTGGNYNVSSTIGNYTYTIPNAPLYYNLTTTPTQTATFSTMGSMDTANHFGFYPIPNQRDLQIFAFNILPPKPGQLFSIGICYKNIGTDTANGKVSLGYANTINYAFANPSGTAIGVDSVQWNYTNLYPGETRTIQVYFNIPTNVVAGNAFVFPMTITSTGNTELTPADNQLNYTVIAVSSYDPNAKEVQPNKVEPSYVQNSGWFYYTIHFQNTGTDTAFNVTIRDTLSYNLILPSLEILGSTHSYQTTLRNPKIIEFSFNNINLLDSNTNYAASQGAIAFKIKANATLPAPTIIPNTAAIYFDYNAPIITNSANIVIDKVSAIEPTILPSNFSIYPNPAKHFVYINKLNKNVQATQIIITDMLGQTVNKIKWQNNLKGIDVSNLLPGIYTISILQDSKLLDNTNLIVE